LFLLVGKTSGNEEKACSVKKILKASDRAPHRTDKRLCSQQKNRDGIQKIPLGSWTRKEYDKEWTVLG
jgi:hypothetical protein